jgi:large subunit ribosomal protein L29
MTTLKASDLHELSVEQLEAKLTETREESFRLGFRSATEAIDSPMRFRTLRRDIARMETVLRQKRQSAGGK